MRSAENKRMSTKGLPRMSSRYRPAMRPAARYRPRAMPTLRRGLAPRAALSVLHARRLTPFLVTNPAALFQIG